MDQTIVFVGLGGTFYCGVPYYAVLLRNLGVKSVVLIDPDDLTEENLKRQWANMPEYVGLSKTQVADVALALASQAPGEGFPRKWEDSEELLREYEGPMILVVNTDNNKSRVAVNEWAAKRAEGPTGVVLSGCDGDGGQAYWSLFDARDTRRDHNALGLHEDVLKEGDGEPRHGCGGQTIYANALTAQLSGLALENLVARMEDPDSPIYEYYWSRHPSGTIKSWTTKVAQNGGAQ